jgi:O-acetyl-ADP-ribose deacetylase (regulator of RNase III)
MQIEVIQGDITQLEVDAIVNAANNPLRGGGGVDGAIHRAGGPEIMSECRKIGYCATGEVVRTTGGRLKVKHLLHTVGPVFKLNDKSLRAKEGLNDLSDFRGSKDYSDGDANYGMPTRLPADSPTRLPADLPTFIEEDQLLKNCYINSIELAEDLNCTSIAFPNISTGVYGFPKVRAVERVAEVMEEIQNRTTLQRIIFCCFDDENYQLYQEKFKT